MRQADDHLQIVGVLIACCKADLHLTRICVASVRFWYPAIPLFLIKDFLAGEFSTAEIERNWNVQVFPAARRCHGWGFAKLESLFGKPGGRLLVLDADTVLLGRVVDALERETADFLVTGEDLPDPEFDYVNTNYYDWKKLHRFDPAFSYPGFCYNTGQLVVRPGILKEDDFAAVVKWGVPPTLRHPEIFRCGEQGVLNYIFAKKWQGQAASVQSVDFGRWASDPVVDGFALNKIVHEGGYPFVLHWAGYKPPSVSRMLRPDILQHYERYYYAKVKGAWLKRRIRAAGIVATAMVTGFSNKARKMIRRRLDEKAATFMKKGVRYVRRVVKGEQIVPNRLRYAWRRLLRRSKGGEQTIIQKKAWEILTELENVFFVQVGSNDGISGDFLHPMLRQRRDWQGIFIEPVGYTFERLRNNLQGKGNYRFENVAIGPREEEVKFYYVSEEARTVLGDDLPSYFDQLGSFNREHIANHLEGILTPYILEKEVRSIPLTNLLEGCGVRRLDLLHIDAEGFDYEVLKLLDFSKYQPKIIVYESSHLSQEDRQGADDLLRSNGYSTEEESGDTLAVRVRSYLNAGTQPG